MTPCPLKEVAGQLRISTHIGTVEQRGEYTGLDMGYRLPLRIGAILGGVSELWDCYPHRLSEPSTRVRIVMIIQILHCSHCQGTNIVRHGKQPEDQSRDSVQCMKKRYLHA
jgi:hypothetical protein